MDPPAWLRRLLSVRRSYINPIELGPAFSETFDALNTRFGGSDLGGLGAFLIADERQTAELLLKSGENAVLFDIGQSAILKSMFSALASREPQDALFKVLIAASSLFVSKSDRRFSELLGDAQCPYVANPFRGDPDQQRAAWFTIKQYFEPIWQHAFEIAIDAFIFAHEHYHLRVVLGRPEPDLEAFITKNYQTFVDHGTAAEGPLSLKDPDVIAEARVKREAGARKAFQLANQAHIAEEIACDMYAMSEVLELLAPDLADEHSSTGILHASVIVVIGVHLLQLHAASLDRAAFYLTRKRGGEDLSDDMGLFNLRRVALATVAAGAYAQACVSNFSEASDDQENIRATAFETMYELINVVYLGMAGELMAPCVIRLNDCFDLVEGTYPVSERDDREGELDPNRRLWLSALPFRLDRNVLNRMFGASSERLVSAALRFM